MAIKIVSKQAKVKTSKQKSGSKAVEHENTVDVLSADTDKCQVSVLVGQTVNIGNYNSVKFSVSVTIPCGETTLDSTFQTAKTWADGKMQVFQKEIAAAKDQGEVSV